jgi:CheY-like chemotaxis protein
VMDGLTAMREIRRREHEREGRLGQRERPRLPVIAVTANVRKEQTDSAVSAGAVCINAILSHTHADEPQDRVMQKPFRAATLVHMMKDLLSITLESTTPEQTEPRTSKDKKKGARDVGDDQTIIKTTAPG